MIHAVIMPGSQSKSLHKEHLRLYWSSYNALSMLNFINEIQVLSPQEEWWGFQIEFNNKLARFRLQNFILNPVFVVGT